MPTVVRDALELLFVVAAGGMLWSALRRVKGGRVVVARCRGCGRAVSRAYERCPGCAADRGPT